MSEVVWAEPKTRNITMLFRTATPEQVRHFSEWYEDAYQLCYTLSLRYTISITKVIGILAALSPLNSWGNNLTLTEKFLRTRGTLDYGYLSKNLDKARSIYNLPGLTYSADVLDILNGIKTCNFFLSIWSEGQVGVCIDRHAYSLAIKQRLTEKQQPTLTPKRYQEVQEKYERAAKILSKEYGYTLTPAMVQSVTWKLWRLKYYKEGAFDQYNEHSFFN